MGFASRFMTALRAGITAYRQESLVSIQELGWDEYQARKYRYALNDLYYNNAIYKNLQTVASRGMGMIGAQRKIDQRLYKHIKGVYNPVYRLIEAYVSKVYGGMLDLDKLDSGSFPVQNADDALRDLLRQQLVHANWRANKSLYVRQGAKYGDIFFKVVDHTTRGRTQIELLRPDYVKDFEKDSDGRIERIIIEYDRMPEDESYIPGREEKAKKPYLYTEIITPDSFSTFKDGEPFAYVNDFEGNPQKEWKNDYGIVPVNHVMHRDEGVEWGAAAFNNSLDKIDELNHQASLLNAAIQKSIDVTWLMIGFNNIDEKTLFNTDEKDDMKVLLAAGATPADVDVKPLVPNINIADTLANIKALQDELERDMPELAMYRMRENPQQTATGSLMANNDAVDKFQEAQGIYDAGISEALQMSIAMSGLRGYNGYQGYSIEMFLDNGFEFYIKPRPIIDDELSKSEKVTALIGSQAPARWTWKELGIADDEIEIAEQEAEERRQEMLSFEIGDNPPQNDNNANPNNP